MKKLLILFLIGISSFVCLKMNVVDAQAKEQVLQMSHDVRKDVKEWRYKVIGKKVYKRLFNVTKDRWETDWILVK